MFSRWNLARNPFDTAPISLGTLDWFVGRVRDIDLCRRLASQRAVIVVEGNLGVGTTSFGNVVRFNTPARTPGMELAVYRGWTAHTLLENVLVAVLHAVLDDPRSKKSAAVRRARSLAERVEKAVHSAGVSLLGFGGHVTRNMAVTQPGIVPMETLRQALLDVAMEFAPPTGGAAFVIQLNNLDPELTFTPEELQAFLNDVRDCLQLPLLSWILIGKSGLSHFITRHVPRLRSIVSHDVAIGPLTLREVREGIKRRIATCALPGRKPRNPIDPALLQDIYEAGGGSLRETFMICAKLCVAVESDPLFDTIGRAEAAAILAELLAVRFADIRKNPLQAAILDEVSKTPGLTQKHLAEQIGKGQTAVSRAVKALVGTELIRCAKHGRTIRYWPAPEVRLATGFLHPPKSS